MKTARCPLFVKKVNRALIIKAQQLTVSNHQQKKCTSFSKKKIELFVTLFGGKGIRSRDRESQKSPSSCSFLLTKRQFYRLPITLSDCFANFTADFCFRDYTIFSFFLSFFLNCFNSSKKT